MMPKTNTNLEVIIDNLSQHGYVIYENFLSDAIIKSLNALVKDLYAQNKMHAAKTGITGKALNINLRGDSIFWLDENSDDINTQAYFIEMQALKNALNQHLFLNVHEIETHLAVYPAGSTYQKHLDQFSQGAGVQARQLSSILYLNNHWQTNDGGELRLYTTEHEHIDILPTAGRLVLFLSAQFWHEVLPAKADRISLTGWFRSRS